MPPVEPIEAVPTVMDEASAATVGFGLRSWIVFLGIGSMALALGTGFWNSAELVAVETQYIPPVHQTGRVAGATVENAPAGPVTISINDGTNTQVFEIVVADQLSVYNLLRVAGLTTVLNSEVVPTTDINNASIVTLAGASAGDGRVWKTRIDGADTVSLTDPLVLPGSTVEFTLTQE